MENESIRMITQEELDLTTECLYGGFHKFLPVYNLKGKKLIGRYVCRRCGCKHTNRSERQPIWDAEIEKARKNRQEKSILNRFLIFLKTLRVYRK